MLGWCWKTKKMFFLNEDTSFFPKFVFVLVQNVTTVCKKRFLLLFDKIYSIQRLSRTVAETPAVALQALGRTTVSVMIIEGFKCLLVWVRTCETTRILCPTAHLCWLIKATLCCKYVWFFVIDLDVFDAFMSFSACDILHFQTEGYSSHNTCRYT